MGALDYIVRSGRALYVGISSYSPESTQQAAELLRDLHTPCLIHQPRYNMLYRDFEKNKLFELLDSEGIGAIVFSPLAQGVLSDRYLQNIPPDSRAVRNSSLKQQTITTELKEKICRLNNIALGRQQSLAQMAVAWILRNPSITSALIGASTVAQIENIVGALHNLSFSTDELSLIDNILQ
jgi:L-glyceraldehyde 3-phosphate reductase